jgi:SAM-dependent methyltransferase
MIGDFHEKSLEQKAFFTVNEIKPFSTNRALDLGCGNGLQSIALANLGFRVTAVDFNSQLISELKSNSQQLPINVLEKNIMDKDLFTEKTDLVVCMGDTLTHLRNKEEIKELINNAFNSLVDKGILIFSFRDLYHELKDEQRFLPVRSDENRIHTCFLEYFPGHVIVNDILHERTPQGWSMKVSSYPKLKVSANELKDFLIQAGFSIEAETVIQRMIYLVAKKSNHLI